MLEAYKQTLIKLREKEEEIRNIDNILANSKEYQDYELCEYFLKKYPIAKATSGASGSVDTGRILDFYCLGGYLYGNYITVAVLRSLVPYTFPYKNQNYTSIPSSTGASNSALNALAYWASSDNSKWIAYLDFIKTRSPKQIYLHDEEEYKKNPNLRLLPKNPKFEEFIKLEQLPSFYENAKKLKKEAKLLELNQEAQTLANLAKSQLEEIKNQAIFTKEELEKITQELESTKILITQLEEETKFIQENITNTEAKAKELEEQKSILLQKEDKREELRASLERLNLQTKELKEEIDKILLEDEELLSAKEEQTQNKENLQNTLLQKQEEKRAKEKELLALLDSIKILNEKIESLNYKDLIDKLLLLQNKHDNLENILMLDVEEIFNKVKDLRISIREKTFKIFALRNKKSILLSLKEKEEILTKQLQNLSFKDELEESKIAQNILYLKEQIKQKIQHQLTLSDELCKSLGLEGILEQKLKDLTLNTKG
ncbi:hypothetical protein B6S12_03920 [Helicobacter valdiviensis]|uniref:Uncharacterized protein n=1 Tax=Helicobacter valdiviensis TaxID=1458358 RepID=A0A2W6MVD0_9HELI|nr:hypothetical protein [Helicobacter valdiviensis]PZT48484.1 hypothetical protein B6S12_03920 [Helicobacter valdiviensis]